ncbi:MAG TPA: hypothetical protein VHA53_09440 [Nitrolancea sp.]|jgi:hypothetical protein|nr:hypothetical protein [Nitrolancea sp.]
MLRLSRALTQVCWLIGSVIAWSFVYYLIVVRDVGTSASFWAPWRLVAYAVFILAPAITFMPIAHRLRLPLYDLEAIAGWSTLAFVITFVDPESQPTLPMMLALLISLVISLATILSLLSYATGQRLFARRSQRYDFVRARREGYLGAIFVAGLLLLAFLKVLAVTNAALLGLIVLLIEIFLLSRGGPSKQETRRLS